MVKSIIEYLKWCKQNKLKVCDSKSLIEFMQLPESYAEELDRETEKQKEEIENT